MPMFCRTPILLPLIAGVLALGGCRTPDHTVADGVIYNTSHELTYAIAGVRLAADSTEFLITLTNNTKDDLRLVDGWSVTQTCWLRMSDGTVLVAEYFVHQAFGPAALSNAEIIPAGQSLGLSAHCARYVTEQESVAISPLRQSRRDELPAAPISLHSAAYTLMGTVVCLKDQAGNQFVFYEVQSTGYTPVEFVQVSGTDKTPPN